MIDVDDLLQESSLKGTANLDIGEGPIQTVIFCGFMECEQFIEPLTAALPPMMIIPYTENPLLKWIFSSLSLLVENEKHSEQIIDLDSISSIMEILFFGCS